MKLAHVHIPKTGGGSIKQWFIENQPKNYTAEGHKLLKNFTTDYDKSFTVIRNTYYRLISVFQWACFTTEDKLNKRKLKNNTKDLKFLENALHYQNQGIISYLNFLLDENDPSIMSLKKWTHDVDIVIRLENINEDFIQIQEILNNHTPLVHKKRNLIYNANSLITNEYVKFVEKHWYEEINQYRYTTDKY
jgi:hypothetical protein